MKSNNNYSEGYANYLKNIKKEKDYINKWLVI